MKSDGSHELHELPEEVATLLQGRDVHPYLLAHLVLVHDTALRLVNMIEDKWPSLEFDRDLILFGAATHDIGKDRVPEEMEGPGNAHHEAGVQWLEQAGIEPHRARFARTHGNWEGANSLPIEDLIVALADVIWAGGRNRMLEDRLTARLADLEKRALWETFLDLDDILIELTRGAELRLVWQTQFAPEREESE